MSQSGSGQPSGSPARPASQPPSWLRVVALVAAAVLALVAVVVLGAALLPGWWAALVGGWVQGVPSRGVWLGLLVGAVFTLLPLAVVALALRSGMRGRVRVVLVLLALVLLLPNVLTIAIALGGGDPRSVIAIEAPSFRGATVVGMAVTLLVVAVVLVVRGWTLRTRITVSRAHERATRLGRQRAAERAAPPPEPDDPDLQDPGRSDPSSRA